MTLLAVPAAQARVLALAEPLPIETVALGAAAGRWAAADVIARRDQPSFDLSAMDGYAIAFAAMPGPWTVVRENVAGALPGGAIGVGEAVRIFTGAALPPGADSILVQEEAARDGATLRLAGDGPARAGANVRRRAGDFAAGAVLVAAGTRLTPARIALAAAGGHGMLAVRRRPRVALVSTGDELVAPGAATPGTSLPSSNAPLLAALLATRAVDVTDLGIVRDDRALLAEAFARAAAAADVVVTTGGASVGDHDLVRPALADAGATLDFWRVAMKPGKPLMAGRLGTAIMLGLPGNPVAAAVTAQLFLLPLLARLGGAADPLPRTHRATLAGPLPSTAGRAEYLRGYRQADGVVAPAVQDSAGLAILAAAELLIVRPPHAPALAGGDSVEILDLG